MRASAHLVVRIEAEDPIGGDLRLLDRIAPLVGMRIESAVEYPHIGKFCQEASVPSVLPLSTTTISLAHRRRDKVRAIFCSSLCVSKTGVIRLSIL